MKSNTQTVLRRVREICLALPDTIETLTWDKPHFRVHEKIFAGFNDENGVTTIGFKLEMEHSKAILEDPRFSRAPYVGHKGWVNMDVSAIMDWNEVRDLIGESYRLIAPKKSLSKLAGKKR
jgi:predicted DNA-binding protein (MmcQ/YjbR family)